MAVVAEAGLEGDFDDFLVRGFQESPCGVETGREDVLTFDSDLSLHNTVHYAPTLAAVHGGDEVRVFEIRAE